MAALQAGLIRFSKSAGDFKEMDVLYNVGNVQPFRVVASASLEGRFPLSASHTEDQPPWAPPQRSHVDHRVWSPFTFTTEENPEFSQ